MRKLFLSAIITLMAINLGLYAQEKDTAQVESKIELKVVYEKTFDESIVDVIFDTVTVSIEEAKKMGWKEGAFEKGEEKTTIPFPKVLFVGEFIRPTKRGVRKIRFYDAAGDLQNNIEVGNMETVNKSRNGKYILIGKYPDEFRPESQGGKLYDSNGKLLREFTKYFPVAVSNDGYVIAGELPYETEASGDFVFYNPQGREVGRTHNPLKDIDAGWAEAKFTEDQEYIIVGYTDLSKSAIIIVHKDGKIFWQKEFNQDAFHRNSEVFGFKGVGVVGISQVKESVYSYFYDWTGGLKWSSPLEIRGDMIVKISEDKKQAFVVSSVGYLWCIDLVDGKVIWKHRELWSPDPKDKTWPRDVPRFRELEVEGDILFILGKQGRDWHSSTLFVFDDENGSLLKKIDFPQEKITFAQIEKEVGLINITKGKVSIFRQEVLK